MASVWGQSSPPPAPVVAVRPVDVARGRGAQASQLPDGLAHGAGVVGQALDVLEGHVDDLVAAGVAVEVAAGQALQAGLVGDAALAVRQVGAQGQGAGQGAALQAAGLAGALLGGRPERQGKRQHVLTAGQTKVLEFVCQANGVFCRTGLVNGFSQRGLRRTDPQEELAPGC